MSEDRLTVRQIAERTGFNSECLRRWLKKRFGPPDGKSYHRRTYPASVTKTVLAEYRSEPYRTDHPKRCRTTAIYYEYANGGD